MIKLLFFCLGFFPLHAYSDEITLTADVWCPFNCQPDSDMPGYVVEIAQAVFSKYGHSVNYKVTPWARSIKSVRQGRIDGIIAAYKEDAPDFIFPEAEIAMVGFGLFVARSNSWDYSGLSSLERISLGAINDYSYGSEIDNYIHKKRGNTNHIQMISGSSPLKSSINMLLLGRFDALIENPSVFWYFAKQMKVDDSVRSAGIAVKPQKAYIGFSPALPKSQLYANLLTEGVHELRASGRLNTILKRYGIEDWY